MGVHLGQSDRYTRLWTDTGIIYFWDEPSETFYLLYIYPKNEQEDLSARQLRILARLVREEFG